MDREIDRNVRRRRLAARIGALALGLATAGVLLAWLPGWLSPTLRASRIRIAPVERGRVEATVEAAGIVEPAYDRVLSSPVETRVLRILKRTGEEVSPGDAILELDTSATRLERERLVERLARKENEQQQVRLERDRTLQDLEAKAATAELDLEMATYRVEQHRRLRAQGLISEEALREVEVGVRKAAIELEHAGNAAGGERRSAAVRLTGLALELSILQKEIDEAGRQLELATARADRAGVLTWVVKDEGSTVRAGEVIARIADLDSFRVQGSASDVHAPKLLIGQPARVVVDKLVLPGIVHNIDPTIEKGVVNFEIILDEADHPVLRNNLRVDVYVVIDAREDVLKVRKFPYATGGSRQDAFVVRGDQAYRAAVRIGLSGYEEFEILEGLQEGDQVIVSDMRDYLHMDEVKIR